MCVRMCAWYMALHGIRVVGMLHTVCAAMCMQCVVAKAEHAVQRAGLWACTGPHVGLCVIRGCVEGVHMGAWYMAWHVNRGHVAGGVWCHAHATFDGCDRACWAVCRVPVHDIVGEAACVSFVGVM